MPPRLRLAWFLLAVFLGAAPSVHAASISINFALTNNDANRVDTNEFALVGNPYAEVVSGQHWNHVPSAPATFTAATQGGNAVNLRDSTGATAAKLTSTGAFFSAATRVTSLHGSDGATPQITGDAGLFQSALFLGGSGNAGESLTITLNNSFNFSAYRILVFFDIGGGGPRTYGLQVTDGLTASTFWTQDTNTDSDPDNDGIMNWKQTLATTSATAVKDANYAMFDGLRGNTFTITGVSTGGRAVITGIQIIALPEPSSLAIWLLEGGGAALYVLRRRSLNRSTQKGA